MPEAAVGERHAEQVTGFFVDQRDLTVERRT